MVDLSACCRYAHLCSLSRFLGRPENPYLSFEIREIVTQVASAADALYCVCQLPGGLQDLRDATSLHKQSIHEGVDNEGAVLYRNFACSRSR